MAPPDLDRKSALFLDLDGTLLEIAATPELVVVPPALPGVLAHLHHQLDGAVAIVSGRPLGQIDGLLAPFLASAAGEHGVSIRYSDGTLEELPVGVAVPDTWREALNEAVERWPGVRVETKPHGVAVHYRLAPEREAEVWQLVRALVLPDHPWFRLIPAREAVEIGLRAASKGHAVERFMGHAPFHGRKPIFIGDDYTDEAGMSMARRFGGVGLRVAEVFGGDPAQVRAWLTHGMERMDGRPPAAPTCVTP
ncbi:MAG: trehalose-phosphatase [Enhydrobacter sp.]|nr:trehalose-phosphatase [Enhydrobacter sp.]